MKKLLACAALACLVLTAPACIVTSLHPFYSDNMVVFDPALVGTWVGEEGKITWTFAREGDKAYRVQVTERKAGTQAGKDETDSKTFIVHLFQLGNARFVDAFPADVQDFSAGTHFLLRVDLGRDSLTARALEEDAVDRAAGGLLRVYPNSNGEAIDRRGGPDADVLLLAPTSELQTFVQEQGQALFEKNGIVMARRK